MKTLENLTLPKNYKANESDKILQTQLTRTFAEKRQADFGNLARRKKTILQKETDLTNQNQT